MKLPRRQFLHLAAGAAALPVVSRIARAQTYPTRPVHLLVGYSAGGPLDIGARLIAQWLSERLGQLVRRGESPRRQRQSRHRGGGARTPDGYTLLVCAATNAGNVTLYDNLSFDFTRDIAPVASYELGGGVMDVNSSVPAKTLPEFIAYAKANPGKINMASAGTGSAPGMYGELFKFMAGVDLVTMNYRGSGPALPDLIAGRVQVMFDPVITAIGPSRRANCAGWQ